MIKKNQHNKFQSKLIQFTKRSINKFKVDKKEARIN